MTNLQLAIVDMLKEYGFVHQIDESGPHYYRDNEFGCMSVYLENDHIDCYYTSSAGVGSEWHLNYTIQDMSNLANLTQE